MVLVFFLFAQLPAKSVNSAQAEKAVRGWLKMNTKPLGMNLGQKLKKTEVFKDADGQPVYYIVYLYPAGFVIVFADDYVEPIVGFVRGDKYDPSPNNPLGALVSRDLPGRLGALRKLQAKTVYSSKKNDLTSDEAILQEKTYKAKEKWDALAAYADTGMIMGLSDTSDVRVPPLLLSQWGQETVCSSNCYNYYTPNNYPTGCVATAMAQLMRFFQHPTVGIGIHNFQITVNGSQRTAKTRGGNGSGGPYDWSQMMLMPDCSITTAQRQAIGDLCYDAGIAAHMYYTSNWSGTWLSDAKTAFRNTFKYSNAILGGTEISSIGSGLNTMINPNLDAGRPVILGIGGNYGRHAVIADGYGYNFSTLYHHINMGWDGYYDAWYNLPNIDSSPSYNVVESCIYNFFTSGTGEIISGRVTDESGNPVNGATVIASSYSAITNNNGIYALTKVRPETSYTITVTKSGYSFTPQTVTTGLSSDWSTSSGNNWEIDFQGSFTLPTDCNIYTLAEGSWDWDYPIHTSYAQSRTQVIYLADEIGHSGNVSALALNVSSEPGWVMDNWTIRMKQTDRSSYDTASFDANGWTTVYQANEWVSSTGWKTFQFAVPFEYDGTSNLLVDFSHNSELTNSSGYCFYSTPGGTRSAYAYSDDADGDPLSWSGITSPAVWGSDSVPDIQLVFCIAPWKFGTYEFLTNASRTVEDSNSVPVTFGLTGRGWGEVVDNSSDFGTIVLHDTNESSVFTISTPTGQATSVRDIIVDGSLKTFSAKTTDLRGSITIDGSVALLELDDTSGGGTISIGPSAIPLATTTLKFDQVSNLNIDSEMPIKTLTCTEWLDNDIDSDSINAPSLGTLQVKGSTTRGIAGSFEADLVLEGSSATTTTLTGAAIAGNVNNSTWNITGNARTIYIKGDANNWDLNTAPGDISSLKVGQIDESTDLGLHIEGKINSMQAASWHGGVIEANAVNSLKIAGNRSAAILGDFDTDLTLLGSNSIVDIGKNTLGSARIAARIIGGTWGITGNVGSIQLGSSQDSSWVCDFSGNVRTLKASGYTDVNGIRVAGVLCVDWSSNSLSSVSAGSIIDANLTLNQGIDPAIYALGKMTAKEWIEDSRITSVGNISGITTGGIRNSSCFAGDIETVADDNGDGVLDLPDPPDANALGDAVIGTFSVKGIKEQPYCVFNSNIAARRFNTVLFTYPQYDNSGTEFGVAADSIGKLTLKDLQNTFLYSNLGDPNELSPGGDDIVIRVK